MASFFKIQGGSMDAKNAIKSTFSENWGWSLISLGIASFVALLTDIFSEWNPIFIFFIAFSIFCGIIYIINFVYWANRRKNGFLNIVPQFDGGYDETEKFAWIEVALKDEFDSARLYVILKRCTEKNASEGTDYIINKKYFGIGLVVEDTPQRVNIASAQEDYMYLLMENTKIPFRTLIDESINYSSQLFELVFEVKGKLNGKYVFSEFYKGDLSFYCTTDPLIIVGQKEERHRAAIVKLENVERYDYFESEDRRKIKKEIVAVKDKMILSEMWNLKAK